MRRQNSVVSSLIAVAVSGSILVGCGSQETAAPPALTPSVGASYASSASAGTSGEVVQNTSDAVTATPAPQSPTTTTTTPATTPPTKAASPAAKPTSLATAAEPDKPVDSVAPVAPTLSKPSAAPAQPAPPATLTTAAAPRATAPQAPIAPATVNFANIDAVAVAAISNACILDAATDAGVAAASARVQPFLLSEAGIDPAQSCANIITTNRFAALKAHQGFVNVSHRALTLPGMPADTATTASRAFYLTITPGGRDGWGEPAWVGYGAVSLSRHDAAQPWKVDLLKVEPGK